MLGQILSVACSVSPWSCTDTLVWLALLGALALVLLCTRRIAGFGWGNPMGAAKWDPKDSWVSTLVGIGAILGTVLSSPIVPKDAQMPGGLKYFALSLFFGALIGFAPFAYNAARWPNKKEDKPRDYHGCVWTFVAANGLTLWAVLGQLTTLSQLLRDLHRLVPGGVGFAFQLLLLSAAIGLPFYARQSIRIAVENAAPKPLDPGARQIREALAEVHVRQEQRPRWSVL